MKYTETLLYFGRSNQNGRIYSADSFRFNESVPVMIDRTNDMGVLFIEQVGTAKLEQYKDTLTAHVEISGDHVEYAKSMLESGHKFVPSGNGSVDDSGYIGNYELLQIIITDNLTSTY